MGMQKPQHLALDRPHWVTETLLMPRAGHELGVGTVVCICECVCPRTVEVGCVSICSAAHIDVCVHLRCVFACVYENVCIYGVAEGACRCVLCVWHMCLPAQLFVSLLLCVNV